MVTQISVAGTLIVCHLFVFQIIVHFFKQKNFFLLHIKAAPDRWIGPFYTFPF